MKKKNLPSILSIGFKYETVCSQTEATWASRAGTWDWKVRVCKVVTGVMRDKHIISLQQPPLRPRATYFYIFWFPILMFHGTSIYRGLLDSWISSWVFYVLLKNHTVLRHCPGMKVGESRGSSYPHQNLNGRCL